MTNFSDLTPEQIAARIKALAEFEGWEYCFIMNRHVEGQFTHDKEGTVESGWTPEYHNDLNALQRIAVKLCKTEEQENLNRGLRSIADVRLYPYAQACLTAQELFIIYSDVVMSPRKETDAD